MVLEWYYSHGEDVRIGPYTPEEMRWLALSGDILRTDTVYKEGVVLGISAEKVRHLFDPAAPTAPTAAVEPPPKTAPVPPGHVPACKRRASGGPGVTILSQDGEYVRFRKRCVTCGHEDSARSVLRIQPGSMRASFFCLKCRKNRDLALTGFQA